MGKIARKFVAGSKSCSRNLSPTHPWGGGANPTPTPPHITRTPGPEGSSALPLHQGHQRDSLARHGERGCERRSVQCLLARSADHQPHDSLGASSKSCPLALFPAVTQQVCGGGFWGTAP